MAISSKRWVGPFVLDLCIGEGATSIVWSAVHGVTTMPAAIKVLKPGVVQDARHREALRYEVRAVASLDHPAIVTVLDQGDVEANGMQDPDGLLPGGSPWVAMALIRGRTLVPWCSRMPWDTVRPVLGALLSALGHAHARGVVHRDVKPGNVLLDEQGIPRLVDFGIAAVLHDRPVIGASAGTPGFMAPEQASGRWRDLGPWTDLYGLGRLALALVCGQPGGGGGCPVPDGFFDWVARLTATDPADRYDRAADAAAVLDALQEPGTERIAARTPDPSAPTWTGDERTGELRLPSPVASLRKRRAVVPLGAGTTPVPPAREATALRLYGLRSVPFAGRETLRERLWAEIRAVHDRNAARVVVLRGPAGVGKTRTASWLCERAHETGVGEILVATHDPNGGSTDGLGPMIARTLRCGPLSGVALLECLERRLATMGLDDPWDRKVIASLVSSGASVGPVERYAVVRRLLAAIGSTRVAIVRIDDAQFGADALGLATAVAAAPWGCRVLFVITARDEALAERPLERERLAALARSPVVQVVDLPPLDEGERRELVRGLLGLEPGLAASVEARSAGNPAFAVALVGDWVNRGLLVPGPLGLELVPGAVLELPDDLLQVWDARIASFLAKRPPSDAIALEVAALLGVRVDRAEWSQACARAGVVASPDLPDVLSEQGLGTSRPEASDWSFAHEMLREAIDRRARVAGRAEALHRACADALVGRSRESERIGLHLAAGGRPEAAVAPLVEAAGACAARGEYRVAERIIGAAMAALEAAGGASDLLRRAPVVALRGNIRGNLGKTEDALVDLTEAERTYRMSAARDAWIRTVINQTRLMRNSGRIAEAERGLDAVAAWVPGALPEARASWHGARAVLLGGQGRLAEAEAASRAGLALTDDPRELPKLAGIVRRSGRLDEAQALLVVAEARTRESGSRLVAGDCANERGELARARGDLAGAEAAYAEALALVAASGSSEVGAIELNLALMRIFAGRAAEVEEGLRAFAHRYERLGRFLFVAAAHAALLACDAVRGDWDGWDTDLAAIAAALHSRPFFHADVARVAEYAARIAEAAGQHGRATDAFALAASQWKGAGYATEAARAAERVETTGSRARARR